MRGTMVMRPWAYAIWERMQSELDARTAELRPRLFLRTTEFLWQEGHTAHASEAEAHA